MGEAKDRGTYEERKTKPKGIVQSVTWRQNSWKWRAYLEEKNRIEKRRAEARQRGRG